MTSHAPTSATPLPPGMPGMPGLPRDFAGRTVAVLGLGRSGLAAARLLLALGARVRLLDKKPASCEQAMADLVAWTGFPGADMVEALAGEHHPGQFDGLDALVMSPGAAIASIRHLLPAAPELPVLAEMELSSRYVTAPMLAVTGTSGKTTTVSLLAAMLRAAGKRVFLGGNIGTPLAEHVLSGEAVDALVLEISSFQLQTCQTFHPRVGAFLNLAPNHLDYHQDMEEYLQAKLRLFARMTGDDLAVIHESLRPEIERRDAVRCRVAWFGDDCALGSGRLLGAHNRANAEAARLCAAAMGVGDAIARSALEAFAPLPHRIEPVDEVKGVLFVNDSKATTLDSLAAALKAMDRPVRLLAGGVFKGGDPAQLDGLLREKVKEVCLFGNSREVFEQAWGGVVPLGWEPTLEAAMRRLFAHAAPGEAMLLSPATASFDLYTSYTRRGDDFRRVVQALREEQA